MPLALEDASKNNNSSGLSKSESLHSFRVQEDVQHSGEFIYDQSLTKIVQVVMTGFAILLQGFFLQQTLFDYSFACVIHTNNNNYDFLWSLWDSLLLLTKNRRYLVNLFNDLVYGLV